MGGEPAASRTSKNIVAARRGRGVGFIDEFLAMRCAGPQLAGPLATLTRCLIAPAQHQDDHADGLDALRHLFKVRSPQHAAVLSEQGSLAQACLAPRRYHPDNTARMPDLSLPEPVKGPEPLCKTTEQDTAKGMWGHAQQYELQYGPVDSSHKVRTPPSRRPKDPRPSSRPLPTGARPR
jgi:hypothetical protein